MAPIALPDGINDQPWEPTDGEYTLVEEGIYPAVIFEIGKGESEKGRFYKGTFRINDGGQFDGEDVKLNYIGLTNPKSLFRIYEILKAIGTIDRYYDAEAKKWKALPSPEELETQKLYIRVEHEEFQSTDKDTKQPKFNDDGSPKMLTGARVTGFYSMKEDAPTFKPTQKRAPAVSATPTGGGFPNAVGGVPTAGGGQPFTGSTPW